MRHHIVLSIVGVGEGDASEIGYYLGKVAQEKAVRSASIPATIIRATQFQSYIPVLIDQHTVDGKVLAPRSFIQPVELDEVIELLAEAVTTPEPGRAVEIAGPDRFYHDDLFRATLAERGDEREVVTVEGQEPLDAMVPRGAYRKEPCGTRLRESPLPECDSGEAHCASLGKGAPCRKILLANPRIAGITGNASVMHHMRSIRSWRSGIVCCRWLSA